MTLKFKCRNCDQEIVVKYLTKGEMTVCRSCGAEIVVPEDAIETDKEPAYRNISPKVLESKPKWREAPNRFPTVPFSSGHNLAQVLILVIIISIALTPVYASYTYSQIKLIQKAIQEGGVSLEEVEAYTHRQSVILLLYYTTLLLVLIPLLIWGHRIYRNLPSLGANGLRFTPIKTVNAWLMPIINLYRPYQVFQEIWRASDPHFDTSDNFSWQSADSNPTIMWWWFLFLFSHSGWSYAMRRVMDSRILKELLFFSWSIMVSYGFSTAAAVLLIHVVRRIDSRQEEKSRLIARYIVCD